MERIETVIAPALATDSNVCRCRLTSDGKITCPAGAKRQLLALLDTPPNLPISPAERDALGAAVNGWFAHLLQAQHQVGSVTAPRREAAVLAAGDPPALPPHMTPLGEQRQLVAGHGRRWIGCARATPEELSYLKGIVIYDETASLFLLEEEAREAFGTLGWFLIQLRSLHVVDERAEEEKRS